jgi:hypothetical protein
MGKDQKFGYGLGLHGGYRPIRFAEIGFLAAAWKGEGNLLVDALVGLLQFNGLVPLSATSSFFGGAQLGLVHRRMDVSGIFSGSGVVGFDSFGYGVQTGVALGVTRRMSLRIELGWLHANKASKTHTNSVGGTSEYTNTYYMDAVDFVHVDAAFCFAF